jgi:predicted nucleotidyltransferase component of viral defense system
VKSISNELYQLIVDLQKLSSLSKFILAGGTSLALRFNHRESIDIDFISNTVVGKKGFKKIVAEIATKKDVVIISSSIINQEFPDQYSFLRLFIVYKNLTVKIEVLQNMQYLFPVENIEGIRLLSLKDLGLMKLMSVSNRKAKKDVYDIDRITDEIDLSELLDYLALKEKKYRYKKYHSLFEMDKEISTSNDILVLLAFDAATNTSDIKTKPNHTHDRIIIPENGRSWVFARSSWRRKVRKVLNLKGIDYSAL